MTRSVLPGIVGLALLLCRPAGAVPPTSTRPQEQPPLQPPRVSLTDGAALVRLVRSATNEYLLHRTPADRQAIPAELTELAKREYTVAVTLRDGGKPVARVVRAGASAPRNTIAAALEAMRSPLLPDRVTQKVLDALTVEVEVLGEPQDVLPDALKAFRPGLTGLMLTRGQVQAYCLASTAYASGLDLERMRQDCLLQASLLQAPLTPETTPVQPRWELFTTKHYVGYPDARSVWLYRGKLLDPPESIDENALAAEAERAGRFLVRRQDSSGCYRCGGDQAPLAEHLYATYAMVRLTKATGGTEFLASAAKALQYASRSVKRQPPAAWVATERPEEDLAATALFVLIAASIPPNEELDSLRGQLVTYLVGELGEKQKLESRLAASKPAGRWLKGAYLACMALDAALTTDSPDRATLAICRGTLAQATPPDAEADLWRIRAGIPDRYSRQATQPAKDLLILPVDDTGPADEVGGFAVVGQAPTTLPTALVAVNLAAQLSEGPEKLTAEAARQAAKDLAAARRFCYRMTFKSREAFFAAAPADWAGAVRASPESAKVTVEACAAAIEAFIAKAPPGR